MVATSYHGSVNVLQAGISPASTPFDRAEWFELLAECGMTPFIAAASEGDTNAILPMMRANGQLEALRNWYSFTWRQWAGDDPQSARLLAALARDLKAHTHRITMWPVPDEDSSAARLCDAFRAGGWSVKMEQCDHNHVLPVNGRSFAEYWDARPGRMKTTLKRKGGKVEVELLTHFDAAAWAAYEEIYAESWKPAEDTPDLLRRFAEAEGAAGRIRLAIARFEGQPIAAQFWTVESGIAYIHKLAHREEHRALSAGTTLSAALFEHVLDIDKVQLVDFGTGNDRYKTDWMEEVRPRFRIDCLDPAQPKAWPALTKRALSGLRPSLASARPHS